MKGYEQRAATAAAVRKIGREGFLEKVFLGATTWGTPDQILERLKYRHDMLGGFEIDLLPIRRAALRVRREIDAVVRRRGTPGAAYLVRAPRGRS